MDELISTVQPIVEPVLSLAGISKSLAVIAASLKGIFIVLTVLTTILVLYIGSKILPPIIRVLGRGIKRLFQKSSRRLRR